MNVLEPENSRHGDRNLAFINVESSSARFGDHAMTTSLTAHPGVRRRAYLRTDLLTRGHAAPYTSLTPPQGEDDPTPEPVCQDANAWERQQACPISLYNAVAPQGSEGSDIHLQLHNYSLQHTPVPRHPISVR